MMLSIADIKKIDPDSDDTPVNPVVKAMVLDVSPIEKTDANVKARFYAVLADQTAAITATVYDEAQHSKFMKGMSVVIMNVLLKSSYIAVTRRSDVAMSRAFDVPEEVLRTAPKLPGTEPTDIQTTLDSPVKTLTSVKGKVTKVKYTMQVSLICSKSTQC